MASSALTLDASKFGAAAISEETRAFNQHLMDLMATGPKWYEVGAKRYREMREAGETPLPGPRYLETAEDFEIPSRDSGRAIPCRVLRPQGGKTAKGVFLHIHGGGWVLQDHKSQDPMLQSLADETDTLVLSVGYRLAPEDPFPAGPEDCYDAAEWLVDHADATFHAPLAFIGGESAGGHLSMLAALHLLGSPKPQYAGFRLKGLLLHFGCYSMEWMPQVYQFRRTPALILDRKMMDAFVAAFLPGLSAADRRRPDVSPLYADLEALRGRLPPALFTCGTEDCLLDDTVFMSAKWLMAGGEALVKFIPGAPHGYIVFPREIKCTGADEGLSAVETFIRAKLA